MRMRKTKTNINQMNSYVIEASVAHSTYRCIMALGNDIKAVLALQVHVVNIGTKF